MSITKLQSKNGQENNTGASQALIPASNLTVGSLIVIGASSFNAGGDPLLTVSDGTNSYTRLAKIATPGAAWLYAWYAVNALATKPTITVTAGIGTSFISESFSEWATTSVLDQAVTSNSGSSATGTPGAQTPTTDNCLAISFATEDSGDTFTADTSFTKLDDVSTGQDIHSQYSIQTTAALVNPRFTWTGGSRAFSALLATFRLTVAAAGGDSNGHAVTHILPGLFDL